MFKTFLIAALLVVSSGYGLTFAARHSSPFGTLSGDWLQDAPPSATISLQERVMKASQIYHIISTFFPGLSQGKFDADYEQYLATVLRAESRREFDLASMAFVADLHDGHSWFYDHWLEQTYGQPIGSGCLSSKRKVDRGTQPAGCDSPRRRDQRHRQHFHR